MDINKLIENFKDVVLNKFAQFEGRAGKREFWYFVLVSLVLSLLISLLRSDVLNYAYSLAILIPSLAVTSRRMHDIGKSGWLTALFVIPVIGAIILLILAAQDGQPGANRYGNNPEPQSGAGEAPAVPQPEPTPMETPAQGPSMPEGPSAEQSHE